MPAPSVQASCTGSSAKLPAPMAAQAGPGSGCVESPSIPRTFRNAPVHPGIATDPAEVTVTETDIARAVRGVHGATGYPDTIGIGAYRLDLHPTTAATHTWTSTRVRSRYHWSFDSETA